jgi:hypothetical protein
MNLLITIYLALLFFVLTPSVLIRLPTNGNKYIVAALHSIIFALIFHFTHNFIWKFTHGVEGLKEGLNCAGKKPQGAWRCNGSNGMWVRSPNTN